MRVEVSPGREAVVDFDTIPTFECVDGCTWCCHRGVFLAESELAGLTQCVDPEPVTTTVDGRPKIGREPKVRAEHVDVDGRVCHFLNDDGLCALQAEHDWKPAACSVFPLEITVKPDGLHVSVRGDAERNCEGLNTSEHRLMDHLDAFLPESLWESIIGTEG